MITNPVTDREQSMKLFMTYLTCGTMSCSYNDDISHSMYVVSFLENI